MKAQSRCDIAFRGILVAGSNVARILKHGIHIDNLLLYYGIDNRTHCSYSSLYLSIFLSFKAKFVSQFSQELCKLESSRRIRAKLRARVGRPQSS